MAQLRIDFQGRREVQAFSWARVQAMRNGVQLALRIARQVGALGQVLAQQVIRILVGAALPEAVRIGKEDLDGEPLGQALMLGHLFPSVIGHGFSQQGGHMREFFVKALSGTRRIRPLHPGQEDQAGGPLGNRRHVGDLAPSIRSVRPRPTRFACLTQGRQQFGAQRPPWQHIQARIDGLGRELFPHIVRIRASKPSGNLFGRAAPSQMGLDILPQPGLQEFARSPRLTGPGPRPRLCCAGTIGMPSCRVTGQLTADGARGSPQHARHPPQRLALGQPQTQGRSVFRTQVCVALF